MPDLLLSSLQYPAHVAVKTWRNFAPQKATGESRRKFTSLWINSPNESISSLPTCGLEHVRGDDSDGKAFGEISGDSPTLLESTAIGAKHRPSSPAIYLPSYENFKASSARSHLESHRSGAHGPIINLPVEHPRSLIPCEQSPSPKILRRRPREAKASF